MDAARRTDLFSPIHRALRCLLAEVAATTAGTDFASLEAAQATGALVARALVFLREHADLEDRGVQRVLEIHAPALARRLADEHVGLEKAAIDVELILPRLRTTELARRVALGAELVRQLGRLIAAQLPHLEREEREANPVLWAALDDAALAELRARAGAELTPERRQAWARLVEV